MGKNEPEQFGRDNETAYLELLRDEGLRLLHAFRSIENKDDRELLTRLAERLAAHAEPSR